MNIYKKSFNLLARKCRLTKYTTENAQGSDISQPELTGLVIKK